MESKITSVNILDIYNEIEEKNKDDSNIDFFAKVGALYGNKLSDIFLGEKEEKEQSNSSITNKKDGGGKANDKNDGPSNLYDKIIQIKTYDEFVSLLMKYGYSKQLVRCAISSQKDKIEEAIGNEKKLKLFERIKNIIEYYSNNESEYKEKLKEKYHEIINSKSNN